MLQLYHFGPAWGTADPSPFCLKVMYWLRLADIPFEARAGMNHLRNAPKSKLPYIDDDGKIIGDSTFIVRYLREKHGDPLANSASERDKASVHAVCKMLEEHTYWALVHNRWLNDDNWDQLTKPQFFGSMPPVVKTLLPAFLRRGLRKALYNQGLGRHSDEEIAALAVADLRCLEDGLKDRDFLLGDDVCDGDATAAAFLTSLAIPPHPSPMREFVQGSAVLTDYLNRVQARVGDALDKAA